MKDTVFFCKSCGNEFAKWSGQCEGCGEWDSLKEVKPTTFGGGKSKLNNSTIGRKSAPKPKLKALSEFAKDLKNSHLQTGVGELDRVLGGGIWNGSIVLLAGEPGVGKSTLLLEVADKFSKSNEVSYFSGEESGEQIAGKLQKFGIEGKALKFSSDTRLESILSHLEKDQPKLCVIDSIQTVQTSANLFNSISGVRQTVSEIARVAKSVGSSVFIIGQFTKSGDVAGPKLLEHMVDVVLSFSGDPRSDLRILRARKNRFGSTDEVGIFRFSAGKLVGVENPSEIFFQSDLDMIPGVSVAVAPEGRRTFMVNVEALTVKTAFGYPKRLADGVSQKRFELLVAVLTRHGVPECGFNDIYLKTTGGFRLADTFSDLAILMAIYSSVKKKTLPEKTAFIGEVSLSGKITLPSDFDKRMKEAKRFGIQKNIISESSNLVKLIGKV